MRESADAAMEWVRNRLTLLAEVPAWIIILICACVLLCVALAAMWLIGGRARRKRQLALMQAAEQRDPVELEREALRVSHQVRPLQSLEETFGFNRLPSGVYGFSSLPLSLDCPVLRTPDARLFEVHKASDGVIRILGFVCPESAARMETGGETVEVCLYSSPVADASVLVSIPLAAVMGCRQRRSKVENVLELTTGPIRGWEGGPQRKPPESEAAAGRASQAGAG